MYSVAGFFCRRYNICKALKVVPRRHAVENRRRQSRHSAAPWSVGLQKPGRTRRSRGHIDIHHYAHTQHPQKEAEQGAGKTVDRTQFQSRKSGAEKTAQQPYRQIDEHENHGESKAAHQSRLFGCEFYGCVSYGIAEEPAHSYGRHKTCYRCHTANKPRHSSRDKCSPGDGKQYVVENFHILMFLQKYKKKR